MQLVPSTPSSKPMTESIRAILAAVSPNDLRKVVESISVPRPTGIPENEAVRGLIIELFSESEVGQLGVKVDEAGNVVVGDPRRAKVLIGAHYDSIPGTPGADDNASAVAALITAARVIGPREQVCFVAFDGEECGFVGSRALVAGLEQHRPEQVHILEMVGQPAEYLARSAIPCPSSRLQPSAISLAWSALMGLGNSWIMCWPRPIAMIFRFRASSVRMFRWR
jgi:Peptidase family M28